MTQAEMAKACGMCLMYYAGFEVMRETPFSIDSGWKESALKLATYHGVDPGELFPDSVVAIREPKAVRKVDGCDMQSLMSSDSAMRALPPDELVEAHDTVTAWEKADAVTVTETSRRDMAMIEMREKGCTMSKIGKRFNVSRERVRQILLRYDNRKTARRIAFQNM